MVGIFTPCLTPQKVGIRLFRSSEELLIRLHLERHLLTFLHANFKTVVTLTFSPPFLPLFIKFRSYFVHLVSSNF
jgi:hypothetical protein